MSNPGDSAAAQVSQSTPAAKSPDTFAQKVNEVAKQLTQGEDGNWKLPENVEADEGVLFAATLEKRRRDTESALGRTRQKLKTEEGLRTKLEQRVTSQVQLNLTPEQAEELDDLRVNDVDSWRVRMNELEEEAKASIREELGQDRSSVSQEAELERRETVLKSFNEEHPDVPITDEVLANDIPPRISQKLKEGKITFEDFLQEAYEFIKAPKKIKDTTVDIDSDPSLSDVGGSANPDPKAVEAQDKDDYKHVVF